MAKKKSKKYKEFKKRIKETNKNNAFMKAHYENQQPGSATNKNRNIQKGILIQ